MLFEVYFIVFFLFKSWGSTTNPQYYPYTINYVDATGKIVKTETTYKAAPAWGENVNKKEEKIVFVFCLI